MELMRIFAGGLPQDIEEKELVDRFSKFGKVSDVELKSKTDATGQWLKSFGYVNIEMTPQSFQKCKSQLSNTIWRDGKITIQLAKQSTCDKYASERKQNLSSKENVKEKKEIKPEIPSILKGAVPGTILPENENWVVTKFQRVVPVMKVRSRDKKKVITYDPSRHSHQIKRLDNDKRELDGVTSVDTLTWSLGTNDNTDDINYRKRMGDFTGLDISTDKRVKRGRTAEDIIAQKKAERESYVDDLEIVPVGGDGKSQIPDKSVAGNASEVNRSRFDSDSDNDHGFVTNNVTLPKTSSAKKVTTTTKMVAKLSSNESSSKCSDTDDSVDLKPSKLTKSCNGSNDTQKKDTSSNSSCSDSSSSEPESVESVKKTKRKSFPGTAAFSDSVKPSTAASPTLIPTHRKQEVRSSASSDSSCSSSDTDDCATNKKISTSASQSAKQASNKKLRSLVKVGNDITVTSPASTMTPTAACTETSLNLGGLSWDLNQLLPASSIGNQSVTPDSLAFLLESAANILRSASNSAKAQAVKSEPNSLTAQEPPPDLKLSNSEINSDSSASAEKKQKRKSKRQRDERRKLSAEEPFTNGGTSLTSADDESVTTQGSSSDSSSPSQERIKSGDEVVTVGASVGSNSSENSDSSFSVTKNEKNLQDKNDNHQKLIKNQSKSESDSTSESSAGKEKKQIGNARISLKKLDKESSSSSETESSAPDSADSSHGTPTSTLKSAHADRHVTSDSSPSSHETSENEKLSTESKLDSAEMKPAGKLPKRPKIKDSKVKKNKLTISVAEKRSLSNKKRLEALAAKKNELKTQQEAVRQSLSNTDKSSSKRIVFDSDSDGEEKPAKKKSKDTTSSVTGKNRKTLFDDSSDENNDGEVYDKMFALKAQFEGEQGVKLLNLQKTYNDDSRFKLTEKFLEAESSSSANEDETGNREAEHTDNKQEDGLDERRKNLEILQSIVGSRNVKIDHPTSAKTKAKKIADTPSTVFRDVSSMQFDPRSQSQDHLKKVVPATEPKKSKKKSKKKEGTDPVVGSEPAPEVTKDRFFEVDIDFNKSATVSNDTGGMTFNFFGDEKTTSESAASGMKFNFLGNKQNSSCESEEETELVAMAADEIPNRFKNPFAERKRFDDESEEDRSEGEAQRDDEKLLAPPIKNVPANNTVVDWFFFKPEDPRLVDGAKRFSKTLDDEILRKKWEEIRPKLVESYLMKSKRAVQKSKNNRTSIIKKRFSAKRSNKTTTRNTSKA